MNDSLTILLGDDDAALRARIGQIAPAAEIIAPDDANALERAQIIYGGAQPEEIGDARNLRWLQLHSAGVNRWPLNELSARGVRVTNASGVHAAPIVEHMFGMLLMHTRALDVALREQSKRDWRGFDMGERAQIICGKTLGVLGVGAIGTHAATVGKAFGMRVIGLRRSGKAAPDIEQMFAPDERLKFFAQTDVVMNTLPITDATRDFMGKAEFEALPDGAIVINTGRGATINTGALLNWLRSEQSGAALLDVTEPEPLPADHPLWEMDKARITSHYSGARPDYQARADDIFADNLQRFIKDEPLHNLVDASVGY